MESKHAIYRERIIQLALEQGLKFTQIAELLHKETNGTKKAGGALKKYCKNVLEELKSVSNKVVSKTDANDYKKKFVLSAWNQSNGQMMNIDKYCDHYSLPRKDISSYKLVSHTGTPYYNIVFKEVANIEGIDFDKILSKYSNFKPLKQVKHISKANIVDFDVLTYTDGHIGMDTNSKNNSMYPVDWSLKSINQSVDSMIKETLNYQSSDILVVDDLGDLYDGYNGFTARGGHTLPQLMTNEESFDAALSLKINTTAQFSSRYERVIVNNICNDNHSGSVAYFVNSALKRFCDKNFKNVEVNNYRQFISHYAIGRICFVVTHGKDDVTLKFGFKPQLDSKGLEKIDQYCKQNHLYKNYDLIVFKKGDSHQALFDMCTSDDFYYFNYPALSPSSQWVQNNFKKGRRGFVLEKWSGMDFSFKPVFL